MTMDNSYNDNYKNDLARSMAIAIEKWLNSHKEDRKILAGTSM